MFKKYIQKKLEESVNKYLAAHPDIKLICVGGSVGKTSTKIAIATILSQQYRVRMHDGNHNSELSAPLAILGVDYPGNIRSPLAWLKVFRTIKQRINNPAAVDVIVQELGADRPGDIQSFGRYLNPDVAVITGVTPEHMENFGSLEAVAQEELALANFSKVAIINRDDIEERFSQLLTNTNINTYGNSGVSEYSFRSQDFSLDAGHTGYFTGPEFVDPNSAKATIKLVGEHSLRPIIAAVTVALRFGMDVAAIMKAVEQIRAVPGRMNLLRGVRESSIIDDSYNSSPAAAAMAIRTLANLPAPQHIAVLGSMNELGSSSAVEHQKIGAMCSPDVIDWVVTVGDEAEKYLAPAAAQNGCFVKSFRDAISAGAFVNKYLDRGGVVLVKGSEAGIFTEEAVKVLLHSTEDEQQLVRQSPAWLEAKNNFFSRF